MPRKNTKALLRRSDKCLAREEAVRAFEAAGRPALARFVRAKGVAVIGDYEILVEDEPDLRAALADDGLDPVHVIHRKGGGNTSGADGRVTVARFGLPWDRNYKLVIHACMPVPAQECTAHGKGRDGG